MKKLIAVIALISVSICFVAQTPHLLNYQAVARDGSGDAIAGKNLNIKIAILADSPTGIVQWEEQHSVLTNDFGVFNLLIGDPLAVKTDGTLDSFSDIEWDGNNYYLRTTIEYETTWHEMPASPIVSVPYALLARETEIGQIPENGDTLYILEGSLAIGTDSPGGSKLTVVSDNDLSDDALFEVKRADGQTVFAVYNDAVRMYVSNGDGTKGPKGGFSIGGFDRTKSTYINDLLWITPDSIRMYINDETVPPKGPKGGFSIGGFDRLKGGNQEFLRVTDDSIRLYIVEGETKGPKGGFSIGGFDRLKGAAGSEYFNVSTDTTGIIDPSENRILWYPAKNAFLTGKVLIEHPDSIGANSMATGFESKSIGDWSQALGYKAIARGDYSTAIGKNAIANDTSSFAFGNEATAKGKNSFSFGQWARADNTDSYAFGKGAIAEGFRSFAFGSAGIDSAGVETGVAHAIGDYSFAIGQGSISSGFGSFSIGLADTASGKYSISLGYKSSATGSYGSTSIGYDSRASGNYSTAIGYTNVASGDHGFAIGIWTTASGFRSIAMGSGSIASNTNSIAIGVETESSGIASTTLGYATKANGRASTAFGYLTTASGDHSTSNGYGTIARGEYSIASGYYSETSTGALASFSMGYTSTTSGMMAVAMGDACVSNGYASIALGSYAEAIGTTSIALGYDLIAKGSYSTAIGNSNSTSGRNTTAMGNHTIARSYGSMVIGRYNDTLLTSSQVSWIDTEPLFIIGNGSSHTARHNTVLVKKNGEIYFPDVYSDNVGATNLDLYIDNTGKIGYITSSIRYKSNISPLENISWLFKLRPVNFTYKTDNKQTKQYGLIAEEVEEINSSFVSYNNNGEVETVLYSKLITPMIKAIQEQEKKIQQQGDLIEQKDLQIKSLEERLKQIESLLGINNPR